MSARDKKIRPEDRLPDRVYRGRKQFEWHPKSGGSKALCPLDSSMEELYRAYFREVDKANELATAQEAANTIDKVVRPRGVQKTVREVAKAYFASRRYTDCAPKTRKSYEENWRNLEMVFGDMGIVMVAPKHIRQYMDSRGKTAPVSANRERALLSNIMVHAIEHELIKSNPCVGVRKFKEVPRSDFYIEDDDYYSFLRESSEIVQVFMELSYLMAARGQDIRKILLTDLRDDGIFINQQKTGKKQLKRWNPRLRHAVELAKQIHAERAAKVKKKSPYLIITRDGVPYSERALISLWKRNKQRVLKSRHLQNPHGEVPTITWTFHDIKAKSISDYQGDKQLFSGHKSRIMMERYNRTPDVVDALDRENDAVFFGRFLGEKLGEEGK
jgi:integrase